MKSCPVTETVRLGFRFSPNRTDSAPPLVLPRVVYFTPLARAFHKSHERAKAAPHTTRFNSGMILEPLIWAPLWPVKITTRPLAPATHRRLSEPRPVDQNRASVRCVHSVHSLPRLVPASGPPAVTLLEICALSIGVGCVIRSTSKPKNK
jgi:hypothetical protein